MVILWPSHPNFWEKRLHEPVFRLCHTMSPSWPLQPSRPRCRGQRSKFLRSLQIRCLTPKTCLCPNTPRRGEMVQPRLLTVVVTLPRGPARVLLDVTLSPSEVWWTFSGRSCLRLITSRGVLSCGDVIQSVVSYIDRRPICYKNGINAAIKLSVLISSTRTNLFYCRGHGEIIVETPLDARLLGTIVTARL